MKYPFAKIPAFPVSLGWIAGILIWYAEGNVIFPLAALFLAAVLSLRKQHFFAFLLYAVPCGWLVSVFNQPDNAPASLVDGRVMTYSAVVERVVTKPGSQTLFLRIDSVGDNESRLNPISPFIIKASELPDWSMAEGQRLRFRSYLEPADRYNSFPYDLDLKNYNLRFGIVAQTFLEDADVVKVGTESSIGQWFAEQRLKVINILARSNLSDEAFGLISAITVGNNDDLDFNVKENYRAAGVAHALALSGFHVGIIIIIVSVILFPMRAFYRLRRLRMAISLILVWFYAAMVGMPDSVVRAALMLSVFLISKIISVDSNPLNALCISVIIILAFFPFSLFSAGFQLSVSAVGGILLLSDKLNPFDPKHHLLYRTAALLCVPSSAIIGTLIITLIHFHRIPLVFALSNVIVSLFLPVLMIAGIMIILLGLIGCNVDLLCKATDSVAEVLDTIVQRIAALPFSEIDSVYLSYWQFFLLSIALFAIFSIVLFPNIKNIVAMVLIFGISIAFFIFANDKIPEKEYFIVRESANTPIVMKEGQIVYALFTCHPRRLDNAVRRFDNRMSDYFSARNIDSVKIVTGDFNFGNSMKDGDLLIIDNRRIGLAVAPGKLDSLPEPTKYALVSGRYHGSMSEIERCFRPDTIIFSRDLTLTHARRLREETNLPIIDLRNTDFNF